jgi:hypothetical protein
VTDLGIVSKDTLGLAVTVSFGSLTDMLTTFDFTSPFTVAKIVRVPERVGAAVHTRLGASPVVGRKLPEGVSHEIASHTPVGPTREVIARHSLKLDGVLEQDQPLVRELKRALTRLTVDVTGHTRVRA